MSAGAGGTNYGVDHENNSNGATSTDLFAFAGGSFENANPIVYQQVIDANGTVKLP